MGRQAIDVSSITPAGPEEVWRLLGDSATWPSWTAIDGFELERPGGADGLGEIRVFVTGRRRVREEIVARVPNQRLGYTVLSGLPVRGYRADIELLPAAAGTAIRWHTTFAAKLPGTGWLIRRALRQATERFVAGLVEHAGAAEAP